MEQLKSRYYKRFIQYVVDAYAPSLKQAKAGHCMKITGLAMKELQMLLPLLKPINPSLAVHILSETEAGEDYVHASKLIELRNDPNKSVLILVPSNSRTSAEDSYGDATFQNLSVAELQHPFFASLVHDIPQDKIVIWDQIVDLLRKEIQPALQDYINYLLYLELKLYDDESWGNGLFVFGILPDKQLAKDPSTIRRRFMLNLDKVTEPLCDFSLTASDRISNLPLQRGTIQKQLMAYLTSDLGIDDKHSLFENIHDHHPEFNYANLPLLEQGNDKVKVMCELAPGKDAKKELVKDEDGKFIVKIPIDKKCKVAFTITTDPAPKDDPDICFFEIALVRLEDFGEEGIIKKTKVGTNKRATRKLSVNISNEMFPDGEYMIRVRALDSNSIVRDMQVEFKEDNIQQAWIEDKKKNPNLIMEAYRIEHKVAYCNETAVFTICNNTEGPRDGQPDKRLKTNSLTQAIIHYRSIHLSRGEDVDITEEGLDRNKWVEGTLNNTYQFDFGPAFAYQIQLPRKLIQLETTFLEQEDEIGHVEALLSGNPTDSKLLNPYDTAIERPLFVKAANLDIPDSLLSLHHDLYEKIKESAEDCSGLTCTFDFTQNVGLVKQYVQEYDAWLRELLEETLDESKIITLQNLDTVNLIVEMPNGAKTNIKLLTPLHPLRLSWIVNLYELYSDWESTTIENPKYKKDWYRKLDKLFQNGLPMEIAPLVLSAGSLDEAYQYIGEVTFGWAVYAKPQEDSANGFSSSYRQLKSYVSMLLNIAREKRIDSDVDTSLVVRHIFNYALSHPYTDKLVINLFNAGDASVFAQALVWLEKLNIGHELSYEIRLFSNDNLLQAGEALKGLLDPESNIAQEAEVFSQASSNRLFPKLRFSFNKIEDYIKKHNEYQAHLTFLVSPFSVHTELVRPDELGKSFYLNGTICKSIVSAKEEGQSFVWDRYFSNKTLSNPITEFANIEVSLFARLQETIGRLLSSTLDESVPATTLRLKDSDKMLLKFVHDSSDWVITFDKNMGPEFYDLPCVGEEDVPYLLDYIPNDETRGISSYLTTKPTSEIESIMVPLFKKYGINIAEKENFKEILEDVRSVSSSLIMQAGATAGKGFEIIGTTLTKRFLEKKGIMKESFLIPIDLHKELFEGLDNGESRADNLVVKIDSKKKEILFSVVEIKCRNASYQPDELHQKILSQIENTILAIRTHFETALDGLDRLDRELKTLELKSLLEFYVRRSLRYGQLDPEVAHEYMLFLSKLSEGYTIRFKQLGVVFDFLQNERQKKEFYGEAVIYTMGKPVVEEILDTSSSLDTQSLDAKDHEFVDFFEPTYTPTSEKKPKMSKAERHENPKFEAPTPDDDYEIIIPKVKTRESSKDNTTASLVSFPDDSQQEGSQQNEKMQSDGIKDEKKSEIVVDNNVSGQEESIHDDVNISVEEEIVDENYQQPKYDVLIGKNGESPQYGMIGRMPGTGRRIALDLNECNTISLFGVQGAGKSYTIGSVIEMVLKQFSNINKLPSPMAGVIFHYSDSMDYAPEFTSMVYPNDEAGQLAKLKAEYGAEAGCIKDVVLLAPTSQVELRQSEYPDLEVHPIGFDSSELQVKDWMFLLGAMGNDSTYIKELKQIMKGCRHDMSLENIRDGVANDAHMSTSQRSLAEQKLDFASEYITDGNKLRQYLRPGRLIIVDLRDEFIDKDEALGLFVVMLNIFSGVTNVNGKAFNKFIVFDEAHKYMNNKDLVDSITTAIREMRHKGVSVMIASQDPMSLPTEIIELSSIVVMHRFSSPAWVKHVQKAITALQTLTPMEMSALGSGEAYIWANKATDKTFTQRPMKITIRPRATKHGGDTIQAVK